MLKQKKVTTARTLLPKDISDRIKAMLYMYNEQYNGQDETRKGEYDLVADIIKGRITVEKLSIALTSVGLGLRFYWELLENWSSAGVDRNGWTPGEWPTDDMNELANIMDDQLSDQERCKLQDLSYSFLPRAYHSMIKQLSETSAGGEIMAIDDPTDRICFAAILLTGSRPTPTKGKDAGYTMTYKHIIGDTMVHSWRIRPQSYAVISRLFKLTPHWIIAGIKDELVLAKHIETERTLDRFQFMDPATQQLFMTTAKAVVGKSNGMKSRG